MRSAMGLDILLMAAAALPAVVALVLASLELFADPLRLMLPILSEFVLLKNTKFGDGKKKLYATRPLLMR